MSGGSNAPLFCKNGVSCLSLCHDIPGLIIQNLVAKYNAGMGEVGNARPDADQIIISGGLSILTDTTDHGKKISHVLKFLICVASLAEKFCSTHLKPYQIIGIINHAHLVRVPICYTHNMIIPDGSPFLFFRFGHVNYFPDFPNILSLPRE